MSDELKLIFKILSILRNSLDYEEFDENRISAHALGVTSVKRDKLLMMLKDKGLIKGLVVSKYIDEPYPVVVSCKNLMITMEGLEYLEENSLMQKAKNLAKGIIEVI